MKRFKNYNSHLIIFYPIIVAIFIFLIGGLGLRQLYQHESFQSQEIQQSMRRVLQPGTRGNIYDRNGVLLVGNRPMFSAVVYLGELRYEFRKAYLKKVKEYKSKNITFNKNKLRQDVRIEVLQKYLNQINTIIGREEKVDIKAIKRHFSQRLLLPFPLIQDLTQEEYALLTEQIPVESPIQVYTDSARYYPFGPAACHTIGYVGSTFDVPEDGVPGKDLTTFSLKGKSGRTGLERYFDERLQGTSGGQIWQVDPVGYQFKKIVDHPPAQGKDLHTSLDIELQLVAERALGEETGAVVAIEVKTGEILALVSHPGYDLNDLSPFIPSKVYNEINERGGWLNRATQGLYPPGSPFKLITTTAGLRTGAITTDSHTHCNGGVRIGNRVFPCARRWGHGDVDVEQTICYSCNIMYFEKSQEMGHKPMADEARLFGLNEQTRIELPFEAKGMLVPDADWKKKALFGLLVRRR